MCGGGWFPQLEDGAKRDQPSRPSPTLQWCPASHGSSGMWVWPPLTSQTQNVWRQPGARVLHQSCCNWVSTLACYAKLPADTAGPPWPMWGCPCPLHPLIGVCPHEHLSHTKLLAAGVSGCISASIWPTGIWTKYWPLHRTRWPFNWADFSPHKRTEEREKRLSSRARLILHQIMEFEWAGFSGHQGWWMQIGHVVVATQWATATDE